jgi:hypothetical protein
MTSLTQEITLKTAALPEMMQYEVLDFISFLYEKLAKSQYNETALLSEQSLAKDWNNKEEDEAWEKFQ